MPNATFRIESVSIEGFKAFTKPQTFRFGGRHVFLFGPNGFGKTSIVEAVRWCLFGLAARAGEIVKNQFYGGSCIVQMTLEGPDGQWTMQRRLRTSSGESDPTIRDPSGALRNLEDVFPLLGRIGPREGTHVIYAAQQPSSRRPEADITDFSYVVYRYLRLEEVPRLSDVLLRLSTDWQVREEETCQAVDGLGEKFSQSIAEVEESLSRITSDPPWGVALTPTQSDTRAKINKLAGDAQKLGAECSSDTLEGLESLQKLFEIGTAISTLLSGELGGLNQKLAERSGLLQAAQSLHQDGHVAVQGIQEQSARSEAVTKKLASALDDSTIENLEEQLRSVESDFEMAQLKLDVVRSSLKYMDAFGHGAERDVCPACGAGVPFGQLKLDLEEVDSSGDSNTKAFLEQRELLRERVSQAKDLARRQANVDTEITQHQGRLEELLTEAGQRFDLPSPPSVELLGEYVNDLRNSCQDLRDALESRNEAKRRWEVRIENARREIQFHQLRSRKARLQRLYDVHYGALHDSLKELGDLRDIADKMRSLLNSRLQERLQQNLPPLAQEMTEVYLRLTESPTFDSISIHHGENSDGSMTLQLRVSSSRGSGTWGVEDGILNGQALNAIQLVPYFVFSRYQEDPLLDLLLLDDPTQAFDTSKIKLLLSELADAASHATLFVATHEEDRFLPVLKDFFCSEDVRAYKAVGMDEEGPRFEDVPITL